MTIEQLWDKESEYYEQLKIYRKKIIENPTSVLNQ